jgi:uncharacterized membrane protein
MGINDWLVEIAGPFFQTYLRSPYVFIVVITLTVYILRQIIADTMSFMLISTALFGSLGMSMGIPLICTTFTSFVATFIYNLPFLSIPWMMGDGASGGFIRFSDVKKSSYIYPIISLLGVLAGVPLWLSSTL